MSQIWLVYGKELREMWNNRKAVWIPIVFILLGVMQPVLTYYMPQILQMSGGLPKGTVIHIPSPAPSDVMAKVQSQFGTLGLLILVLAFMGTVSAERQRGILELVLLKPVSYMNYILGKWCALVSMVVIAVGLGYSAAWYYTVTLIGSVSWLHTLTSGAVYALWLIIILTLTELFSTLLQSSIATAFISLLIAAVLSMASSLFHLKWSPGYLTIHSVQLIHGGTLTTSLTLCLLIGTAVVTCALLGAGCALRGRVACARE